MPRNFLISFKENKKARSATKSNIAYNLFNRMGSFRKIKDLLIYNFKRRKFKI